MTASSRGQKATNSLPAIIFAAAVPAAAAALLLIPASRAVFLDLTASYPYIMGFFKFALLAEVGEVLALRISSGTFSFPRGALAKSAVWGLIGIMITLFIPLFGAGVEGAQQSGLLLGAGNAFVTALFTSIAINATFGVSMMAFHRVTDHVIEHWGKERSRRVHTAIKAADWPAFFNFVVLRTIPFFWIPAHTVTFLLPPEYRVFLSAVLSIVLGLLLAFARRPVSPKAPSR